jgi:hypothetical protein
MLILLFVKCVQRDPTSALNGEVIIALDCRFPVFVVVRRTLSYVIDSFPFAVSDTLLQCKSQNCIILIVPFSPVRQNNNVHPAFQPDWRIDILLEDTSAYRTIVKRIQ